MAWGELKAMLPRVPFLIRLKTQQGKHLKETVVTVTEVINHGGHTDSEFQFVLEDGTHVASDYAEVLRWKPEQ